MSEEDLTKEELEAQKALDDKKDDKGNQDNPDDSKNEEEKMFTQSEFEESLKDRLAREQAKLTKEKELAVAEAQKLSKMNEEEKREFEFESLQEELAELKKKDAYYGLSKEASKMLAEEGIQADDELLQFVVKEDADETKESIGAFVSLINRKVEEGVQKALAGNSPRVNTRKGQSITQEEFNEMEYKERNQLYKKQPELYEQLTEGE